MQRREFLRIALLSPLAAAMPGIGFGGEVGPAVDRMPDGRPHRFELGHRQFLLDGAPFQIRSGEMHPARIPAEYWQHRIRMAKAMGLNTIAVYLMWNTFESEPGVFDVSTGRRDFARFIELCQQEGMWVYLRPGPYVCAEWDFGGLPPYLLRDPDNRVRTKDNAHYMEAVARYFDVVAPRVKPLMAAHGGPILMVQIENEYASFGKDLDYLLRLKAMWQQRGIDGPFSISDGLEEIQKTKTYVPGAALGLDGDTDFASGQIIAGDAPVWVGEGYPGWLTHWGDPLFQTGHYAQTLRQLLADGCSFNLYVVHGGTNFGFGAGANAKWDYSQFEPVITSYDYGAPINERGEATRDYYTFRSLIAQHVSSRLPDPPPAPPTVTFADVQAHPFASIWENLPPAQDVMKPRPNEILFAQDHGMVVYSKTLSSGGMLHIEGLRDYGTVFSAEKYLDYLSRVEKPGIHPTQHVDIPPPANGAGAVLEILVDSFGHVGYGQAMYDFKGIVGAATLDGQELLGWQAHSLPLDETYLAGLVALHDAKTSIRPGMFFKATIDLSELGDCYLDMSAWDKGYVWVNGQLLGRYWNIGPQQRLYCPASWFVHGRNDVLVFDMHRISGAPIRCSSRLQG